MEDVNIEIESALRAVEILKKYKSAKTQAEKDGLLNELDHIYKWVYVLITKRGYNPDDLIVGLEKAVKLDKYRPKNMSIAQFAISKDLEYVKGDFNTFSRKLSQMVKNGEKREKIRDLFKGGTANIYMLAKQFSADWIRRLNDHKDLVDMVRNSDDNNIIDAYNKLFDAMKDDFCIEYHCNIDSKVVKNWDVLKEEDKPSDLTLDAFERPEHILLLPTSMPDDEKEIEIDKFRKDPKNYQGHKKIVSRIRINFEHIKEKTTTHDFFYRMVSVFAHEMHHALDHQHPRNGALGPQIEIIDDAIYDVKDKEAYGNSATEQSSYTIEAELFRQLSDGRF